jgi:hypothetical protein
MTPFGARQHFPNYVGGGDLWGEPDPVPPKWWHRIVRALLFWA